MWQPFCVFVHEYITGGGWAPDRLPEDLAAEGAAMLQALLADFASWGRARTLTLLDRRLETFDLLADKIIYVERGNYEACFASALALCEAALVIGPETGEVLADLSDRVTAAGACLLGSSARAVRLAGDKWACYRQWQAAHVPTPATLCADIGRAAHIADELGYPLVIKPLDGAGCEGVCLARDAHELDYALNLVGKQLSKQTILLQRYLTGKHASVSLLVADGQILPLSLNGQEVQVGCPFSYRGGLVPLVHPAHQAAFAVAKAAATAIPGLRGYVGVDLILETGRAWAIEINPRLTTAYVGLRHVVDINLAEAIWMACVDGILPQAARLHGRVTFSKDRPGGLEEVA